MTGRCKLHTLLVRLFMSPLMAQSHDTTHTHTHIYTQTHTLPHAHTHTHTHTHTPFHLHYTRPVARNIKALKGHMCTCICAHNLPCIIGIWYALKHTQSHTHTHTLRFIKGTTSQRTRTHHPLHTPHVNALWLWRNESDLQAETGGAIKCVSSSPLARPLLIHYGRISGAATP